jgi:sigma-B regulation protein RsbU (phosphoserine phosphatase)
VDYRTFGILLLNESSNELEMKVAVQFDDKVTLPQVPLGEGLVGYAALHRESVMVPDVSKDPRYIKVVDDVKSELVVPMLLKDRCIGVFDLESPELDAFTKRDVEILTLLASQAAVAIENARLYEEVSQTEARLEKELRFARRVQAALLPTTLPKRIKAVRALRRVQVVAVDDHLVLLRLATEDRVVVEQQAGALAVAFEGMGCHQPGKATADDDEIEFPGVGYTGRIGNPVTAGH